MPTNASNFYFQSVYTYKQFVHKEGANNLRKQRTIIRVCLQRGRTLCARIPRNRARDCIRIQPYHGHRMESRSVKVKLCGDPRLEKAHLYTCIRMYVVHTQVLCSGGVSETAEIPLRTHGIFHDRLAKIHTSS